MEAYDPIEESVAKYKAIWERLRAEEEVLRRLVQPLATSVGACDDLLRLLPGSGVSFMVREIRENLIAKRQK